MSAVPGVGGSTGGSVPDVPSSCCLLHGDHLTSYPALAALCRPRVSLAHSHQQSFTHEEKTTTIYFHSLIFPQADKRLSGPDFVVCEADLCITACSKSVIILTNLL